MCVHIDKAEDMCTVTKGPATDELQTDNRQITDMTGISVDATGCIKHTAYNGAKAVCFAPHALQIKSKTCQADQTPVE